MASPYYGSGKLFQIINASVATDYFNADPTRTAVFSLGADPQQTLNYGAPLERNVIIRPQPAPNPEP